MKILVISDTHRNNAYFSELINEIGKIDMLVHCGDISGSEYYYENSVLCEAVMILGNNDYSLDLKDDAYIEAEGHKIWVNHGHLYKVHRDRESLMEEAYRRGADIVLYGHTHVPRVEYDEILGVYAANPGSLALPRQENHRPSYMIMNVEEGNVEFDIRYV